MPCALALAAMGPYYESMCKELGWEVDAAFLAELKYALPRHHLHHTSMCFPCLIRLLHRREANAKELAAKTAAIEDAKVNHGEVEVLDAIMALADFHARIGNKVRGCACSAVAGEPIA